MSTDLFKSDLAIPESSQAMPGQPLCPGDLPLVLLPVRLETRFVRLDTGSTELRIRVFPDRIHLDSHEPDITADEQAWAQHYWRQNWSAGSDTVAMASAWRQVADRFGPNRAAWIVHMQQPTNAAQRPVTPSTAGQPPAVEPIFPAITLADAPESWRRAPQARLLPDRWIAVAHSAGRVALTAVSNDVRRPLAVGPDPRAPAPDAQSAAAIARGEQLAVDPGITWLTDFAEAESAGMALRMVVPDATLAAGLDSLVVFGVTRSLSVAESSAELAALLDAHHYTDGLAFVRPGTPTNNTEDRRAGYRSDDPGHEGSFALEVMTSPAPGDNNAARVGTALGLTVDQIETVLGRVDRGLDRDDRDMRAMNTALWSVGWGYFLSNMIGAQAGLTPSGLDWAREHFIDHVRGFGPLPGLRCGPQPYGMLPVTSLDFWRPRAGQTDSDQDKWLRDMLVTLRDSIWRPAARSAPRIGNRQDPPDPDADLADVMRTDAISSSFRAHSVFGSHFLEHLHRFLGVEMPQSDPMQTALLRDLGIAWTPRLARLWNAGWDRSVSVPLVQAGEVSPWRKLEPNYISALLGLTRIEDVLQAGGSDGGVALLQMLLRHGLLAEIAHAAARLQEDAGDNRAQLLHDAELVDLVTDAPPTLHWRRQLDRRLPITGTSTIGEYLQSQTTFTTPALRALGEFRASLAHLAELDTEALSLLMRATLDLSAHRLDAWVTSIATKRLLAIRAGAPAGLYIGDYGWLENVKPIPESSAQPVLSPPAGEPGPLQTATNDSGFVHAPSPTHATAAALLRNAQLGATGVPSAEGPFAIDLSSRRARQASRLLDGVRQGQPLGALLGYRLERALHDTAVGNGRSLDRFIAPLRRAAPLVARAGPNPTAPVDAIAADNVVDGLVLHRRWTEERDAVLAEVATAGPAVADIQALTSILDGLGDTIDGLTDALTAESAYQLVRGTTSRVAGTLASIAQGDAPPPELEVTRAPRSGASLTHRLLVLMSGPSLNTPGWLTGDAGVRSSTERMINYWAYTLLGDGSKIRCTIERLDDATGAVVETRSLPLSEVSVTPLDVVYGVEAAGTTALPTNQYSEIEQLVIYHARRMVGGFDPQAVLRLRQERPTGLGPGELTLFDALEQARAIRRLLALARHAGPEDLNPAERTSLGSIDITELEARTVRAENALNAAHKTLATLITRIATTSTADVLRAALLRLGAFGIGPAVPVSAGGDDPTTRAVLARQGKALLTISGARLDRGAELRNQPAATEQRARSNQLVARIRAVHGESFVVLPRFALDPAAATELSAALGSAPSLLVGDPLAVHTWFLRSARVRDPVARLSMCLQRAEVLGAPAHLDLGVAQLPLVAGERWVALPPAAGSAIPASKLSLVLHTIRPVNPAQSLTALLVDEWVEIVPRATEDTALTFQFDAPGSCAPQSVLIAVPPEPGQDWTPEMLRRVLMETLDLAKLRAVDTASLGAAAQYLPALYLAFNVDDHAVSTDFGPLTH
jgi:hypothetical protein